MSRLFISRMAVNDWFERILSQGIFDLTIIGAAEEGLIILKRLSKPRFCFQDHGSDIAAMLALFSAMIAISSFVDLLLF